MGRPARKYTIQLGPCFIPTGQNEMTLVAEATQHVITGNQLKHVFGADVGYLQILNNEGDVIFEAPTATVLWVTSELLGGGEVIPLFGHLKLVDDEPSDEPA